MDYQTAIKQINQKQLAPVYLLFGEEKYLADSLLAQLKAAVLDPATSDFNYDQIDGETASVETIVSAANTLPVLAECRLVIVKNTGLFGLRGKGNLNPEEETGSSAEEILSNYLRDPNPSTVLVFIAEGGVERRHRLFKLVEQRGAVVELASFKGKTLTDWVEQQVKQKGKTIKRDALQYLVGLDGADLSQLSQEIEKACLFIGEKETIDLAVVQKLRPPSSETRVYAVVDAVMEKKPAAAIGLVRRMLFAGEQPTRVFYLLVRQFRLLAQVKSLEDQGLSAQEIRTQVPGVSAYVVGKCRQQAGNFSWPELSRAFQLCREVDLALKTSTGQPALLLEMLIIQLCGKN
ncbi:MAG: DNA polymerase III subunit delta [Firmicutes bacterium]|nr:DNA polymerase III subunit delta [Bacillota bacterium]